MEQARLSASELGSSHPAGSYRDLQACAESSDVLLVELYTPGFGALVGAGCCPLSVLLAAAAAAPGGCFRHPAAAVTLPLRRHLDIGGCGTVTLSAAVVGAGDAAPPIAEPPSLHPLRLLPFVPALLVTRKTVFLLRHGQSRWNEAQRSRRLDALVAFDHPLTRLGAEQAIALRERWRTECAADVTAAAIMQAPPASAPKPSDASFWDAGAATDARPPLPPPPPAPLIDLLSDDLAQLAPPGPVQVLTPPAPPASEDAEWRAAWLASVFLASSPLTRALQTALLALQGHPSLRTAPEDGGGLTLLRCAREVKGVGSLDSIGRATGSECLVRAQKLLLEELPEALFGDAVATACSTAVVCPGDAACEWWTGADDVDTEADVAERLTELLSTLQHARGSSAILVGHSLLFRELIRRCERHSHGAGLFATEQQELCARLCEGKLVNCGVLGLWLEFCGARVRVRSARLLFASSIVA